MPASFADSIIIVELSQKYCYNQALSSLCKQVKYSETGVSINGGVATLQVHFVKLSLLQHDPRECRPTLKVQGSSEGVMILQLRFINFVNLTTREGRVLQVATLQSSMLTT